MVLSIGLLRMRITVSQFGASAETGGQAPADRSTSSSTAFADFLHAEFNAPARCGENSTLGKARSVSPEGTGSWGKTSVATLIRRWTRFRPVHRNPERPRGSAKSAMPGLHETQLIAVEQMLVFGRDRGDHKHETALCQNLIQRCRLNSEPRKMAIWQTRIEDTRTAAGRKAGRSAWCALPRSPKPMNRLGSVKSSGIPVPQAHIVPSHREKRACSLWMPRAS